METSIRTFHPRRSRIAPTAAEALERLLPLRSGDLGSGDWVPDEGILLEVGAGMGHSALQWAAANPDRIVFAVDVHTPGIGRILRDAEAASLSNLRVGIGDAVPFVRDHCPRAGLAGVRILYPDPWPKARHQKRRLIQPDFVASLAQAMQPGATLHLATDWSDYADQMVAVLESASGFTAVSRLNERALGRPETGFERKAERAGRRSADVIATRTSA